MAVTESQWRQQAREVIQRTLAELPANASIFEKRRAVSRAYPYGPRKYHPYKMWLAEVRLALGRDLDTARKDVTEVAIQMTDTLWISVWCLVCDKQPSRRYTLKSGCLLCNDWRAELSECVERSEWQTYRAAAVESGPAYVGILSDWCDENGFWRVAEALRRKAKS